MFIKIKLEPQSLKALSPLKKISYFSINDDATIINLKMKIEQYVDVPAERQEIRTLTKVFENSWYVKEECDVRGSAIMLYAYDEYYEYDEPQFVCFLQVYTNELAAQQQELEQRSKDSIARTKLTPSSSTSSITLIADSDADKDLKETDTESSSSKSSESDSESSTDNSDSSCGKKRSKLEKKNGIQNKKLKVTVPSGGQYSETLCQYLDEFPKCSKQMNTNDNKERTNEPKDSNECQNKGSNSNDFNALSKGDIAPENFQQPEPKQVMLSSNPNLNKIQSNIITTTNNNKQNKNIHPCYLINPEIRDFLAIICSNGTNTINNAECEELLVWFFDQFRACDSLNSLQFDNKNAISFYDGKLWIACMNIDTYQWLSANIIKYSLKSYKILTLKDSKHLCEVVVPVVSNSKNILDIFDLLEKQNKNVTTLKWSIQSRQQLLAEDKDFNEKAISTFCSNEMFKIVMDTESREYLEKLNFKLKYCFWQIVFKFI